MDQQNLDEQQPLHPQESTGEPTAPLVDTHAEISLASVTPPVDEDGDELPADDHEVAGTEPFTPEQKPVQFTSKWPATVPLSEKDAQAFSLALFREAYSNVAEMLERSSALLDRMEERETQLMDKYRKQGRELPEHERNEWLATLMRAHQHAQINETGEEATARDGSHWVQAIEYEGHTLRAGQPKQKLSGGNHSKEELLTYMARRAGVGTVFDVPLVHSGLWVRLKTPSLAALASLQQQLAQIKVTLGAITKGLAFSNINHSLTTAAADFALQYVIDANVHYNTPSDLKEKLNLMDVPILLWGLAVTLYPKGYPYAHPCVADPQKCNHITKELLNLNYLLWTDTNSLTANQKKLLAKRFNKLTEEEWKAYHSEKVRGGPRMVWFGDMGLTLKTPTLQEYEDAGREWINGIIEMTQGAFNEPPHGANRDHYISQLGQATQARQFAHWVAAIHERDDDGTEGLVSDDPDVMNEALMHIFSTEEFFDRFAEEVSKYTEDCLISLVAIPSFNCPACNTPAAQKFNERFDHLVPLDVLTTFFTLVNLKRS